MMVACVGCGRPTSPGPKCDTCAASGPANERPYDEMAWRRTSKAFLKRHRWCVLCLANGVSTQATVADHWPLTRKELLAQGIENPDTHDRLRPLCTSHHATDGRRTRMRFDNDPA